MQNVIFISTFNKRSISLKVGAIFKKIYAILKSKVSEKEYVFYKTQLPKSFSKVR